MKKWKYILVLISFLLTGVWLVDGLKCYQCGTFLAMTSVSRCQNLTRDHLKDCPHPFCSKYVGLNTAVYGCEPSCVEKPQGAFETYCCNTDRCNSTMKNDPLPHFYLLSVFLLCWIGRHIAFLYD